MNESGLMFFTHVLDFEDIVDDRSVADVLSDEDPVICTKDLKFFFLKRMLQSDWSLHTERFWLLISHGAHEGKLMPSSSSTKEGLTELPNMKTWLMEFKQHDYFYQMKSVSFMLKNTPNFL